MSVDLRTRTDAAAVESDPTVLLDDVLAGALDAAAEGGRSTVRDDLAPLVLEVEGMRRVLTVRHGVAELRTVDDGAGFDDLGRAAVLHLDRQQLADLVVDQCTPISWLADGSLRLDGGGLALLLDWWLVLRGALDGVAPHRPGAIGFTDLDGRPLDLGRSFTLDDPIEERAHFLHEAGFLHLRGVFDPGEMAAVSADMDREAPGFTKGDGRSWWAVLHDGSDALVRMQGFEALSDATARVIDDERLLGVGSLTGDGHRMRSDHTGGRCEALFKPLGVREGISDIPWHKDCSLGRHSFDCCSLTIGVSVTGADAGSGQLRVVAGSHRALMWPAPSVQPGIDLPVLDLPTGTGDLTVHCSCTLHMAQPPVTAPRRVVYTSLVMDPLDPEGAAVAHARRNAIREAAPVTVSQPPTR